MKVKAQGEIEEKPKYAKLLDFMNHTLRRIKNDMEEHIQDRLDLEKKLRDIDLKRIEDWFTTCTQHKIKDCVHRPCAECDKNIRKLYRVIYQNVGLIQKDEY